MGALSGFHTLFRFIVGGQDCGLLAQVVDLLRQVIQLGALGGFHTLFCFIVGSQGCGLLAQVVDLLRQVIQLGALSGFHALLRFIVGGQDCGLLTQVVDLLRQVGQLGALGRLVFGRRKRFHLSFQASQVVMGGEGIQLGCQRLQVSRARRIGAGELVGLLAQGSQLLLNNSNLLALSVFFGLRGFIIGDQGRGLLVQAVDLLCQGGQLGALSSLIVGQRKGSHLRFQGREFVGLLLLAGGVFSIGVLQRRHTHLVCVHIGGVLSETPFDGDDVDHQENDDGEQGQRDGPVEQRFQEGRHLRVSFLLRHISSPLRDEA